MSIVPRLKASPGVLVRTLVSLGAVLAVVAAVAAYASGQAVLGAGLGSEFVLLVAIGALSRRYGVALPGNGFSSYIVGVTAFAVLDRGWACAALVAPTAMVAGDLLSRRLPAPCTSASAASWAPTRSTRRISRHSPRCSRSYPSSSTPRSTSSSRSVARWRG